MIQVSRSLIRQLRAVLRRSVLRGSKAFYPPVVFQAARDGMTIHCQQDGIAVALQVPGRQTAAQIVVPAIALADFEGKDDSIATLEATSPTTAIVRWNDAGVPRQKEYEVPANGSLPELPKSPDRFTDIDPSLLKALHEAAQTAAHESVRYATTNIQLRGQAGEIVATDCRQLLVQNGFQFPWTEDVLIPPVAAFNSSELAQAGIVSIGKTADHVCIKAGPWTFWLRIEKDGRFPRHEIVTPKLTACTSHLHLAPSDAAYLSTALPRLPGQEDEQPTVTLDLNGQVLVRARAEKQKQCTEIALVGSNATGKVIRYAVRRDHVARAIDLGFTEIHIVDQNTPAICQDDCRKYVFTCLGKDAALAPGANDVKIRSDSQSSVNQQEPIERRTAPVRHQRTSAPPPTIANDNGQPSSNVNGQHQPIGNGQHQANGHQTNGNGFTALLDEAQLVQNMLRDALNRTNLLIGGLKQYRRHAKTMQSTLTALRQLEPVEA